MKKNIRYIPILLSFLFLSGVGISSFHLHNLLYIHTDLDHPEIVQDHNFCSLCASQFKITSDTETSSEQLLDCEESYHFDIFSEYQDTMIHVQNCRAPPLFV